MLLRYLRFSIAVIFVAGFPAFVAPLQAQDTQATQSVADAAARAKEAKKKSAAKSKVLTEDDLNGKSARAGEPPASTAQPDGAAPAASNASAPSADSAREKSPSDAKKEDDPEVARLKAQLADAEQDLDLAKREAALANDTYYSNPDHARDSGGKAKLDALQLQVNDKQKAVQDLKDRLAALGAKPASTTPPAPRS